MIVRYTDMIPSEVVFDTSDVVAYEIEDTFTWTTMYLFLKHGLTLTVNMKSREDVSRFEKKYLNYFQVKRGGDHDITNNA